MHTPLRNFPLSASALAVALLVSACGGGDAEPPPDIVAPTVSITDSEDAAVASGAVTFTFTFSESVGSSFTADDVTVAGGTKGEFVMAADGLSATLVVTPEENSSGTLRVDVASAAFSDASGNASTAAFTASQDYSTASATGSGSTGTCTASPCINFDGGAIALTAFGAVGSAVVVDPADATNMVGKIVKPPTAETWGGVTIDPNGTDSRVVAAFGFETSKQVTLRVLSPAAGITIMLKVENSSDAGVYMEATALTTKANEWETLTFNYATPSNGTYQADKTYDRVSVFPYFNAKPDSELTFYIDELNYSPVSTTPPGGSNTVLAFGTGSVTFEPFEGLAAAEIAADPTNASNQVAKLVKVPGGQPWAGATVYTDAGTKGVGPIGFGTSKIITMRVYSPAVGKVIMLKVENSANGAINMEKQVTTTVANGWETLSFDFSAPSAGSYDASKVYDKISIFPDFLVAQTADTSYYFDDLSFPTGTTSGGGGGGGTGGLVSLAGGVFASNYSESPTPWASVEGGTAGRYIDTGVVTQDWWSGLAAGDATPSFYFGYGVNDQAKPWGFGAYVSAPGNGVADVSPYSNLRLAVWGNDQLMTRSPTLTVILKGAEVSGCTSELKGTLTVTGIGVQNYTLPLSGFTLQTACAYATAAQALAGGVSQIHIQVLGDQLQYTSGSDGAGNYPNGLNIGPMSFN